MAKTNGKTLGYLRVSTADQDVEKNKAEILGAADKAATLEDVSSSPSIAQFGRVAYPMRGKVTTHVLLGRRSHSCSVSEVGR